MDHIARTFNIAVLVNVVKWIHQSYMTISNSSFLVMETVLAILAHVGAPLVASLKLPQKIKMIILVHHLAVMSIMCLKRVKGME